MTTHILKILPAYFDAIHFGKKRCEIRFNDRDYWPGDHLVLLEWDGNRLQHTGRMLHADITHMLTSNDFCGLKNNYVALSIEVVRP